MAQFHITLDSELLHGIFTGEGRDQAFSKLLETIFNQVLLCQSKEQLGAAPYERTAERKAYRNGFRDRQITTRIGTLTLNVPRHRNGDFSTELFERYQRSEQALILAMVEMVVNGVSTRKVTQITEELCGKNYSKSMVSDLCQSLDPIVENFRTRPLTEEYPFVLVDALYIKVRELGRVINKAFQIAIGISKEGYREVIGLQISERESEASWEEFFQSLKDRGLKNPDLITSDNHGGLVKAIHKTFIGSLWQRCQTHFTRNILDKTPTAFQKQIKEDLRLIYEAIDTESAQRAKESLIDLYERSCPKAVKLLEESFDDITAVLHLPLKYQKKLRTTNGVERLNEEIRRRERVIRIFPNEQSAIRLIGALLIEQDEKWSTGRKYLDMEPFHQEKNRQREHTTPQRIA